MFPTDAPQCHACGSAPRFQWARLATPEEAAEQRREITILQGRALDDAEIAMRYGPLRTAVTGCTGHHLGGDPGDPDSGLDLRALLHDADCRGHGACQCGQPDAMKRTVA
jgi:hypothetical protein